MCVHIYGGDHPPVHVDVIGTASPGPVAMPTGWLAGARLGRQADAAPRSAGAGLWQRGDVPGCGKKACPARHPAMRSGSASPDWPGVSSPGLPGGMRPGTRRGRKARRSGSRRNRPSAARARSRPLPPPARFRLGPICRPSRADGGGCLRPPRAGSRAIRTARTRTLPGASTASRLGTWWQHGKTALSRTISLGF